MIRPPVLSEGLNSYLCHWPDPPIEIRFDHLSREKRQRISAEVTVLAGNGTRDLADKLILHPLASAAFDLTSASGKETLWKKAKRKTEQGDPLLAIAPWEDMVDTACYLVLEEARKPEKAQEGTTEEEVRLPPYVLRPLLREGQPTILHGDGGAGKGLLACYCYICLTIPWPGNDLGLGIAVSPAHRVLYLDWEADYSTTLYRLKALALGIGEPGALPVPVSLLYRRCYNPLVEDLETLGEIIRAKKVDTVIVDSLLPAAGVSSGDPAGPALALIGGLRKLNVTGFIIGHISKGQLGSDSKDPKAVYGSRFYHNLARLSWELRSTKISAGETRELKIALFDRKSNDAWPTEKPLGLSIGFHDLVDGSATRITVERADIAKVPELAQGLTHKERIAETLRRGPLSINDIAESIDAKTDTVRKALERNPEIFIPLGALWGLISRAEGLES